MGIELYSKLKEYLENHLEQLRPVHNNSLDLRRYSIDVHNVCVCTCTGWGEFNG